MEDDTTLFSKDQAQIPDAFRVMYAFFKLKLCLNLLKINTWEEPSTRILLTWKSIWFCLLALLFIMVGGINLLLKCEFNPLKLPFKLSNFHIQVLLYWKMPYKQLHTRHYINVIICSDKWMFFLFLSKDKYFQENCQRFKIHQTGQCIYSFPYYP